MQNHPKKTSSWKAKLGLMIGGLLMGLILAEGSARLISPNKAADLLFNASDASPMDLYIIDAQTRVSTAPNIDATINTVDYSVHLRTNELGLRGPNANSISDTGQWIALGDSFTMSVQVNEEDTFEYVLGEALGHHVWNAGVDGYSTWQATLRLKQMLPQLPIKNVLLVFFTGNDFQDNERFLAMARSPLPGPVGSVIPRPQISGWDKFLLRYSYIYAHYRIWNKQQQLGSKHDFSKGNWQDELRLFSNSGSNRLNQLRQSTKRALAELQQFCRENQLNLHVAVAPPAFAVVTDRATPTFELVDLDPTQANLDAPQQMVLSILKELNISSCDLTNDLRQGKTPYLTFDGHWTKEGHQIVAKTLQSCVK